MIMVASHKNSHISLLFENYQFMQLLQWRIFQSIIAPGNVAWENVSQQSVLSSEVIQSRNTSQKYMLMLFLPEMSILEDLEHKRIQVNKILLKNHVHLSGRY